MKRNPIILIIYCLITFTASSQVRKENQFSIISGKVFDEEGNVPLVGANVVVVGTDKGAVTDLLGDYKISIVGGIHKLRFSMIGYTGKIIDTIKVKENDTLYLNVKLSSRDPDSIYWQLRAKQDLGEGIVHLVSFGLRVIPLPESLYNPIASKYKLQYVDGESVPMSIQNTRSYNKVVYDYLDSLNGVGWRERMETEIAIIRQKMK